jgi:hypothetical protein
MKETAQPRPGAGAEPCPRYLSNVSGRAAQACRWIAGKNWWMKVCGVVSWVAGYESVFPA